MRKSRYMTRWLTVLVTVALYALLAGSVLAHGGIASAQTETIASSLAQLEDRVISVASIRGTACSRLERVSKPASLLLRC